MLKFQSDYLDGCHPNILKALNETNYILTDGYGLDEYSLKAKELIINKVNQKADVHFVVGGTQANIVVISSALKPHEAIISLESGHINVHETGAIEATGHKILTFNYKRYSLNDLEELIIKYEEDLDKEHMVKPRMVYLSIPSEYGLTYDKNSLKKLYNLCHKHNLYLFVDGARLAYALNNDLTLEDLGKYTDLFYIGGTKCGALFGEAIVIINDNLKTDFRYHIKQRGAMLAKGRILGIQFYELFKDDLYLKIGESANSLALKARNKMEELGIEFPIDSHTNQQFFYLSSDEYNLIKDKVSLSIIEKYKDGFILRFCVGVLTTPSSVQELITIFKELKKNQF